MSVDKGEIKKMGYQSQERIQDWSYDKITKGKVFGFEIQVRFFLISILVYPTL